ncbi:MULTISPECIES: superoxide dismutase [Chitinophagaceae]
MDKRTFIKDMGMIGAGVLVSGKSFAFKRDYLPVAPFKPDTLAYDFNALEPTIDAETMRIHYTKHYQAYIDNLNKAIVANTTYANQDILSILKNVKASDTAVRNNAGGYYNHSLFWKWLSSKPTSPLPNYSLPSPNSLEVWTTLKRNLEKLLQVSLAQVGLGWLSTTSN